MFNYMVKKMSKKIGLSPGSVVYVGTPKTEKVTIDIIDYDQTNYEEKNNVTIEECLKYIITDTVTWINVNGVHDEEIVKNLCDHYEIHPLTQEDIANTGQRPKLEEFPDYIVLILKMLSLSEESEHIVSEQVSIVFGKNFVISFQEYAGDVFDRVRDRLKKTSPRLRFRRSDYLAYALADAVVDHYFLLLEHYSDISEELEQRTLTSPRKEDMETVHHIKRGLILIRRSVWPLREATGALAKLESTLIDESTRIYISDLYEHVLHVIDSVESIREMVSSLMDMYLSSISNRMNQVMKVLTIIATIFIPLSFFAGVYGMNFDTSSPFNMPELSYKYGYLMFWGIVIVLGVGLLIFFKRKDWL